MTNPANITATLSLKTKRFTKKIKKAKRRMKKFAKLARKIRKLL